MSSGPARSCLARVDAGRGVRTNGLLTRHVLPAVWVNGIAWSLSAHNGNGQLGQ